MIKWIKKLFLITLAITLVAIAVNMFLGPHKIAAGGLTGLRDNFRGFFEYRPFYYNTYR